MVMAAAASTGGGHYRRGGVGRIWAVELSPCEVTRDDVRERHALFARVSWTCRGITVAPPRVGERLMKSVLAVIVVVGTLAAAPTPAAAQTHTDVQGFGGVTV